MQAAADKRGSIRPVWFYGPGDSSWAVVVLHDGHRESVVRQSGPRRLWDEVEAAFRWWEDQGRPGPERFGLTVDASRQYAWLDDPAGSWAL